MRESNQDFYTDLLNKHGWKHVAPWLKVLPEIEAEIQKRKLATFTSHEVLNVTAHATYPEWFDDDLLLLVPDRSGAARMIFLSKDDPAKMSIVDFIGEGGSFISYDELIPSILPFLDKLAEKKSS